MAKVGRPSRFSSEDKREIWERWKRGETLSEISVALSCVPGSVHRVVASNGGYVPAGRQRREGRLRLLEREEISRGLSSGESIRSIAAKLGRAPSTVSREVRRNGGPEFYRAVAADEAAWMAAKRPQEPLLAKNGRLRELIAEKLAEDWSPEQISGWLERDSEGLGMRISTETIYKSLFVQTRGVLDKALAGHLRTRRGYRRRRSPDRGHKGQGQIVGAISIKERPESVNGRSSPGHWEGDLIIGKKSSAVATLVERKTRLATLVRVRGKDSPTVVSALSGHMKRGGLPEIESITWDRGTELARHKSLTAATGVTVYFADAKSLWQRGTNENTNKLIRQYLPKGVDLSAYTQGELDVIAEKLNNRPRINYLPALLTVA